MKGYYNKYYLSHDANCNMTNIWLVSHVLQFVYKQNLRNEGNICHIAQSYCAITMHYNLSLAKKWIYCSTVGVTLNNTKKCTGVQ